MNDPVRMEVIQGVDQLLGDLPDLVLGQGLVVFEDLEQFALCKLAKITTGEGNLGDDAEFVRRFKGVDHQDDVLVDQASEDFDFLSQVVQVLLGFPPKVRKPVRTSWG